MYRFKIIKYLIKVKHISLMNIFYILLVFDEEDEQYYDYLNHLKSLDFSKINNISIIEDLFNFFDGYCDCC